MLALEQWAQTASAIVLFGFLWLWGFLLKEGAGRKEKDRGHHGRKGALRKEKGEGSERDRGH